MLGSLHSLCYRARPVTNIDSIDILLKIFQHGGDFQDLSSTIDPSSYPRKPPIIEITSRPGQGKTQLLYFLITIAVLPATDPSSEITLGGQNSAVIFLDTDGRFDVSRLAQIMQLYISIHRASQDNKLGRQDRYSAQEVIADDNDAALIRTSLEHVHVCAPQSLESLLATLDTLGTYLSGFDEQLSASRCLSAIILDSASAFYWQERRRVEDAKLPIHLQTIDPSFTEAEIKDPPINPYAQLRQSLSTLSKDYLCPVIVTTRSNNRHVISRPSEPAVPPELPLPWPTFPTLRLHVMRWTVDKYPPIHSVQEALRDKMTRQGVVRRGRYEISLNYWASDTWGQRVKSALENRATATSLWIGEEGVWVKDNEVANDSWPPWVDLMKAGQDVASEDNA